MRGLKILLLSLLSLSCARQAPFEPTTVARPDTPFSLRPGQEAVIQGTSLRLYFVGVPEDSRCPVDVECVWAGDARLRLRLEDPTRPDLEFDLHTTLEPQSVVVAGYRVTLQRLEPARRSDEDLPVGNYRAYLLISPTP